MRNTCITCALKNLAGLRKKQMNNPPLWWIGFLKYLRFLGRSKVEMSNNIPEVLRKVVEAQGKIDRGAMMARNEMMTSLIQLSKEQIQGKRQKGEKAESGKPPKNRTGNLRRSIQGKPMREGFATYSALVGPTIIYGRRVELGGGNWPSGTKFPYMKPAWERFRPLALNIIRKHLAL